MAYSQLREPETPSHDMEAFVAEHAEKIRGTLSCFDRFSSVATSRS